MMVEILLDLKTGESEAELRALVEEFVGRLTGRQTMYQMIELARQIELRGGRPLDPLEYKRLYYARLNGLIEGRIASLRRGEIPPDEMMVPGARRLLDALRERGLKMYLASGTDQDYMREEARLLGLEEYFPGGIFGALDDYKSFSKKILIERILSSSEFRGEEFLGFGDGFVEIENVKQVGGVAVGVATDEPLCLRVEPVKRRRLAASGADWIIPNYNCYHDLMSALFPA
jgi:phosphoglycolate phosphatase-like HAD superfamily hydrolase